MNHGAERISSHLINDVYQFLASLVLGSETSWKLRMLLAWVPISMLLTGPLSFKFFTCCEYKGLSLF